MSKNEKLHGTRLPCERRARGFHWDNVSATVSPFGDFVCNVVHDNDKRRLYEINQRETKRIFYARKNDFRFRPSSDGRVTPPT